MTITLFIIDSMFYEYFDIVLDDNGIALETIPKFVKTIDFSIGKQKIMDIFSRKSDRVEIYLVDDKNKINMFYTEEGKKEFNKFKENTKKYNLVTNRWSLFQQNYEFNDGDIYIFATIQKFKSTYEMASDLNIKLKPNHYFCHSLSNLNEILDETLCYSPFNPFTKYEYIIPIDSLGRRLKIPNITDEIKILINDGIEHLENCIKAGFLNKEKFVQQPVLSWTMNIFTLFMHSCIINLGLDYFEGNKVEGIYSDGSKMSFKIPQEEFMISVEYRYKVVITMIEVLYTFFRAYLSKEHFKLNIETFTNPNTYIEMKRLLHDFGRVNYDNLI